MRRTKKTKHVPQCSRKRLLDLVTLILSGLYEENGTLKASDGKSEFLTEKIPEAIIQTMREFPELFENSFTEFAAYKDSYCKNLEVTLNNLASVQLIRYEKKQTLITAGEKDKRAFLSILRIYYSENELRRFPPTVRRFNELVNASKN